MEPQAECMLVLMGATPEGKELIGFQTGMRRSGQSWKELLVDLKARSLSVAPASRHWRWRAPGSGRPSTRAFPTTPVISDAGCTELERGIDKLRSHDATQYPQGSAQRDLAVSEPGKRRKRR